MKNKNNIKYIVYKKYNKTLRIMKISTLLIFISAFNLLAESTYSQGKDISLKIAKTNTIENVISEIEKTTDYVFIYNGDVISTLRKEVKVVDITNQSLDEILNQLLKGTDLGYSLASKQVTLYKDERKIVYAQIKSEDPILIQQQTGRTISGIIVDERGEPVIGANIIENGTTNGTITDVDGKFRFNVGEKAILSISYIGYLEQEVNTQGKNALSIVLHEDTMALEELVVVGYGTQERKEITSAVSSIKEDEFNKGNVNDPLTLMQGKVAGLSISKPGSDPNSQATVRLRGVSTLGGNSEPLVVVDGVIGVNLDMVDPNDISTIDVLKDASAAAIYGSRGASGVILITTKNGTSGKSRIEYNAYVSAEEVAHTLPVMNADEYRELGIGPDYGFNTNWLDEITRTAISQSHSIALSGGSENTIYRASVNYRDIQGVTLNSGYDRYNARINLTQKALDNRLSFSFNMMGAMSNSKGPDFGDYGPYRNATYYNPTAPVRSDEPQYEKYGGYFQQTLSGYFNPVAMLEQVRNERQTNMLNLNLQAVYEPIEDLKLLARYSRQRAMSENGQYTPKVSLGTGTNRNGMASRDETTNNNQLFESTATYEANVSSLKMTGLLGYSYQEFLNNGFGVNAGDFLTDAFEYHNLGAALDFNNGLSRGNSYQNSNKIIGFFGRLNLNYANTYFLSASLRKEGSTMFGEGKKWGHFPASSVGVDISEIFDLDRVNNLKIRASYGVTGNTPGSSYLSLQKLSPIGNFYYNGDWITSYGPSSNPNPNLGWEKKSEFDIGIDFGVWNNRFTGSFDYYNRTTSDLIYSIAVPIPPNLVDKTDLNIGEISSSGLELSLTYRALRTEMFSWTTSVNGTYYIDNILGSLSDAAAGLEFGGRRFTSFLGGPGLTTVPATVVFEGQKLGQLWGYRYQGVDENGKWILKDLNESGSIEIEEDQTVIGNAFPTFQLGWSNSFTFGNFDLNLFFRGTFGHDIVNTNRVFLENPTGGVYNVVKTKYYNEKLSDVPIMSDFYVEKGDFIKLDNVTLGYSLPFDSKAISNLRIYLTGQNLFTITGYTGVDPELRQANPLAAGVETRSSSVRTRSFSLGLNLAF